jgi:hypothetical protein
MKTGSGEEAATMKTSVVMPIHNEEDLLPYSLHSMLNAPVYEFVFVLDRCTDRSKEIVSRFATRVGRCKILEKSETRWLNPAAEAYDFGAEHAGGDCIYFIDADVVVDKKIFDPKQWQKGNALRFRYYNYDIRGIPIRWAYEKTLLKTTERLGISTGHFATVIAFKRYQWMKTRHESPPENIEGLRKNPHLVLRGIMMREHERRFARIADTNCLHLRPKTTASEQELQGIARYMLGYRLWKVALHSIMYFQIHTLIAFLYARSGHYGDLKRWVQAS